jgi:hypothetical protein
VAKIWCEILGMSVRLFVVQVLPSNGPTDSIDTLTAHLTTQCPNPLFDLSVVLAAIRVALVRLVSNHI